MENITSSKTLIDELNTITNLFENLHSKTKESIAILEKKETEWKIRQDQINDNIKKVSQKVVLNIGGKIFASTRDTLLSKENSFFYAMLSNGKWLPDEDGSYFIDRDPKYFRYLLNYLRSGECPDLSALSDVQLRELKKEANFYCLDDMFETLKLHDSFSLKMLFKEATMRVSSNPLNSRKISISRDGNYSGYLKSYNLTKLSKGTFKWSIKIHEISSWFGIGVVSSDRVEQQIFDDFVSPYKNHGCYMVSNNSYSWQHNISHTANAFPFCAGNEIQIVFSCERGEITFTNTSNNKSITISNVPLPVYPCIVTNGKFSVDFEWLSH